MNWRGIKRKLIVIAVVVFILPPALWVYYDVITARQLEAKVAALRAQGIPVTMVEAAPQPVPDEQNAAVLYQQVFQVQFVPGGHSSGRNIGGLSNAEYEVLFSYYQVANYQQLTGPIRELLARSSVQQDLETLRRASRRPHSVFPVNWADGFCVLIPHMGKFMEATRILSMQTHLCASEGDVEEAMGWCEVSLRMSEHVASEPTLITQTAAINMQAITLKDFRRHILPVCIPPAAADRFERYLRHIDMYESFTNTMIGERAIGCDVFDQVPSESGEFFDLMDMYPLLPLYFSRLARPLLRMDHMIYLDYMGKEIQLAKLPARTAVPKCTALQTDVMQLPWWRTIVTGIVWPVFVRATVKRDKTVANIDLCRIVLTLKAYKYEQGRYPDSLQQLQQTLDWQLPQDPFSGQDFIYRREGEGFLVYSIGADLEDDSGRAEEDWDEGDIVWRCAK